MWNKDEIEGKGKQVTGAIKEKTGQLIEDPELESRGDAEQVAGAIQGKIGAVRRKTGEAIVKAAKAIAKKL